jgi:hypothetical protein
MEIAMSQKSHYPTSMSATIMMFISVVCFSVRPIQADDPYTVATINVPIEVSGLHPHTCGVLGRLYLYKTEASLTADLDPDNWSDNIWTPSANSVDHYNPGTFDGYQGNNLDQSCSNKGSLCVSCADADGEPGIDECHKSGTLIFKIETSDYKADGSQLTFDDLGVTHYRIMPFLKRMTKWPNGQDKTPANQSYEVGDNCAGEYGYDCVSNTNAAWPEGLYGPISDLVAGE